MKIFFFGLGYCARRLIQREPWIEASGTARTRGERRRAASRGRRSLSVRRRRGGAGAGAGARKGRGDRRLDPAARWGRGDARALRGRHRRRAGAAAHRLLFDHRGLRRPRRRLGRRDQRDADAHGARAGAARGRGPLDGGGPGARGRSRHPAPCRHLWARPQCARQSAPWRGAADRQAGPGVQPRPCR